MGLVVLFGGGVLLGGGFASGQTIETTTTTAPETTPIAPTTVVETATVLQTTTQRVIVHPPSTTTEPTTSSSSSTPTWAWVALAVLGALVIGLVVVLLTRHRGGVSSEERQKRLNAAVATWAAQGWVLERQTADSVVLRRDGDLMVVSVDEGGNVSAQPLAGR